MRRARVAELYTGGIPVADIARELGVLPATIHSLLTMMRREGWELPQRRRRDGAADRVPEPRADDADWQGVARSLDAAIRRHWQDRDDDALYEARDRVVPDASPRLRSMTRTREPGVPHHEAAKGSRPKSLTTRISYSFVRSCTEAVRVTCGRSHSSTGSRAASA